MDRAELGGEGLNTPEHDEQCAFVTWTRLSHKRYPGLEFAFAVPNGSARHPAVAAKLKAEGVRKGVIDWLCPVRMHGFNGVGIEFKAGKNKLTPEQKDFVDFLRSQQWLVEVCYSAGEAIATVERYFRCPTKIKSPESM